MRLLLAMALACAAAGAGAQTTRSVAFSGSMGDKALLVIDGQPRMLAAGASHQGVKLIGMSDGQAQVEVDGRRALLRIGAPVNLGPAPREGAGTQIVLTAGLGGHFITGGNINGRAVQFLVDTGATNVAMSQADADRVGLDYRKARRGMSQTANGVIPVNFVTLNSVRIGDVEVYNVEAAVIPAQMSHVLLGNSFLTRFQMKRENDRLTLDKRP